MPTLNSTLNTIAHIRQRLHQALRANPHQANVYHQLGRLAYRSGDWNESIDWFQKALRLDPCHAETQFHLGNAYTQKNQFDLAMAHYQQTLQCQAQHHKALVNLGMLYLQDSLWAQASHCLQPAFEQDPQDLSTGTQLARAYLEQGKLEEAKRIYQQVLSLNPQLEEAQHNLAILCLKEGEHAQALRHFQVSLTLNPHNETAKHMVQALSPSNSNNPSQEPPPTLAHPPRAYVRALFDQYASYYDQHLQSTLNYQIPTEIRNQLGQVLGPHRSRLRVLDLGCGTGLCGLYCRDLAFQLSGVDLSPQMLACAKQLGAYDQLIEQEIVDFLRSTNESAKEKADVIIAAEVLNYLGDLEPFFQAAFQALNSNAYLVFTVEHDPEDKHDSSQAKPATPKLQPSGRITHPRTYVSDLIHRLGINSVRLLDPLPVILRQHGDQAIPGSLFLVHRP